MRERIAKGRRKHGMSYEMWTEPPRRRTVLRHNEMNMNQATFTADWPWVTFLVQKRKGVFDSLAVFVSRVKPDGPDFMMKQPELGHVLGSYFACLGDDWDERGDPIDRFWNTSFGWNTVPSAQEWKHRLWHGELRKPRDIIGLRPGQLIGGAGTRPERAVLGRYLGLEDEMAKPLLSRIVALVLLPALMAFMVAYSVYDNSPLMLIMWSTMLWVSCGVIAYGSARATSHYLSERVRVLAEDLGVANPGSAITVHMPFAITMLMAPVAYLTELFSSKLFKMGLDLRFRTRRPEPAE